MAVCSAAKRQASASFSANGVIVRTASEVDVAISGSTSRLHSTVTGELVDGGGLDADYWVRDLRRPVRFADVVAATTTRTTWSPRSRPSRWPRWAC